MTYNPLLTALRQYRHNHVEGFVFGYDKAETDRIVTKLVEALERISKMDSMSYHSLESAKIVARKTITAYRKGDDL